MNQAFSSLSLGAPITVPQSYPPNMNTNQTHIVSQQVPRQNLVTQKQLVRINQMGPQNFPNMNQGNVNIMAQAQPNLTFSMPPQTSMAPPDFFPHPSVNIIMTQAFSQGYMPTNTRAFNQGYIPTNAQAFNHGYSPTMTTPKHKLSRKL
jgi:hypothetical protein